MARRKGVPVRIREAVHRESKLFQVVRTLRAAASRTFCTAGTNSAIRMAMIAITTSNSIRVKPRLIRQLVHRNSPENDGSRFQEKDLFLEQVDSLKAT